MESDASILLELNYSHTFLLTGVIDSAVTASTPGPTAQSTCQVLKDPFGNSYSTFDSEGNPTGLVGANGHKDPAAPLYYKLSGFQSGMTYQFKCGMPGHTDMELDVQIN
jgi:hypothetical protein